MSRKLYSFRLDENEVTKLRQEASQMGITLTALVSQRLFKDSKTENNLSSKKNNQDLSKRKSEDYIDNNEKSLFHSKLLIPMLELILKNHSHSENSSDQSRILLALSDLIENNKKQQEKIDLIEQEIQEMKNKYQ